MTDSDARAKPMLPGTARVAFAFGLTLAFGFALAGESDSPAGPLSHLWRPTRARSWDDGLRRTGKAHAPGHRPSSVRLRLDARLRLRSGGGVGLPRRPPLAPLATDARSLVG